MSFLPRSVRCGRSWLAVYAVCVVFVFSFIVFETLDVDGSDFPASTTKMAVKLAESPHDDLRRAWLAAPIHCAVKTMVPILDRSDDANQLERTTTRDSEPLVSLRHYRIALPRASLSDLPPFA